MSDKLQVLCPQCSAVNRVDPHKAEEAQPVCGRCSQRLEPRAPGYPIPVTDRDFEGQVLRAGLPVLVDFWASWCGPCRQLEPEIKELARLQAGRLRVCKMDTEQNPLTPQKYGIRGIPTLILFRGVEAGRVSGYLPVAKLQQFVGRLLD